MRLTSIATCIVTSWMSFAFDGYNKADIHCTEKLFNFLKIAAQIKYTLQMISIKYPEFLEEFFLFFSNEHAPMYII